MSAENLPVYTRMALLPAIGNHEGKALLETVMTPKVVYTADGLQAKLAALTPEGELETRWAANTAVTWCRNSMQPFANLVENVGPKFRLNRETTEAGKAFAGLSLQIGEDYAISLQKLWGKASGPGKIPAPSTRFVILDRILRHHGQVSVKQVGEGIGIDKATVYDHLRRLAMQDLVSYSADQAKVTDPVFRLAKRLPSNSQTSLVMVSVRNYLEWQGQGSVSQILQYHQQRLIEAGASPDAIKIDTVRLTHAVRSALHNAVSRGNAVKLAGDNTVQQVVLNDYQRMMWTDIFSRIRRFETGDPKHHQQLAEQGKQFSRDKQLVVKAVKRAKAIKKNA